MRVKTICEFCGNNFWRLNDSECPFCGNHNWAIEKKKIMKNVFLIQCPWCKTQFWNNTSCCPKCGNNVHWKGNRLMTAPIIENATGTEIESDSNADVTGPNESWEVKIDTVHECSKAPKEITVKVDLKAKLKIDALMEQYPNIEWLAYLIGKREEGKLNPYYVVDIHIPDQEVTSTNVDKVNCPEFNSLGVIGVIHSHHGMGTGFSGTDHNFINGNHNLSLVIAKNGVAGQYRWTAPCGSLKIISEIKVKVVYPQIGFDKKEWLDVETKKIKRYAAPVTTYEYGGYGGNYYGAGYGWQGRNKHLNPSQRQFTNGVSVKQAANRTKKDDDVYDTGLNSDDSPEFDDMQSLEDALNEAFNG